MEITKKQQQEINKIGNKYQLRFIIIHGSYARGEEKKGSDLDVAVYGKKRIDFEKRMKMYGDFEQIFGNNRERELDIKTLHDTNPFFRFEAVRDGKLIYGDKNDFDEYYLFAYKDFMDSRSLFKLQDEIINRRQLHLNKITKQYA